MALTPDEKDTLTALEQQLRADDRTLAAALARGLRPPRRSGGHILPACQVAPLIGALFVLAAFGQAIANRFGVIGIGIITGSLIVPWFITSDRAASHGHNPVPTARPTSPTSVTRSPSASHQGTATGSPMADPPSRTSAA